METLLLGARVLLAGVFAVAGITKLLDRAGSRRSLAGFGVPEPLVRPLAWLLPLAELAVAVLLLPVATAWWGAAGALALLGAFMAAIGVNLARGRRPDCHCFGQLHSAPAGWATVARNGVLALVALGVLVRGPGRVGPSVTGWLATGLQPGGILAAGLVLSLLLTGVLGWIVISLWRQQGRLLLRIEALEAGPRAQMERTAPGLPPGATAPAFALPDPEGRTVSLASLLARGRPTLLLFTDPGCGPCNALLPEVAEWQKAGGKHVSVVLVSRGEAELNRIRAGEHGLETVLLQEDFEVAGAYRVAGTPSAVLVQADGTIGTRLAAGEAAIRALLAELWPRAGGPLPALQRVGDRAPAFELPDLDGRIVRLADFRGGELLLLFWDPGCGFCQRMLPELRAWEAARPEGAPRLVVISRGSAEASRNDGFQAPVLLDPDFRVGRRFTAHGTPTAVRIDARGRLASGVAVGAEEVMALANQGARVAAG